MISFCVVYFSIFRCQLCNTHHSYPADTQRPENAPLWSYFVRDVPDLNRTKIVRFKFLDYFGSAMYGMPLASGNIEKNFLKTYFIKNVQVDVLGMSKGRHAAHVILGRF